MRDDENFNSGMRDKNAWREKDLCILTGKMRESFENDGGISAGEKQKITRTLSVKYLKISKLDGMDCATTNFGIL